MTTILQYIQPSKYDSHMFKVILIDNTTKNQLKIVESYKFGDPILFIKTKNITKKCQLIKDDYYLLKVVKNGKCKKYCLNFTEKPAERCSINYSSDSD